MEVGNLGKTYSLLNLAYVGVVLIPRVELGTSPLPRVRSTN